MSTCRNALILAGCFALSLFLGTRAASAQDWEMRVITANNVACRAEPTRDAASVTRLGVGDRLYSGEHSESAGELWYQDQGCPVRS